MTNKNLFFSIYSKKASAETEAFLFSKALVLSAKKSEIGNTKAKQIIL